MVNTLPEKIAEVKNLSKIFGKTVAVSDVSFDVHKGDIFGFLGPNGSGKSTTIRAMLSLITPTSGEIRLFGKEIRNNREYILSKIGCIVEKPDFYPYLSAEKNLEIFARISGSDIPKTRIPEMLEFVGLKGREKDKVGPPVPEKSGVKGERGTQSFTLRLYCSGIFRTDR